MMASSATTVPAHVNPGWWHLKPAVSAAGFSISTHITARPAPRRGPARSWLAAGSGSCAVRAAPVNSRPCGDLDRASPARPRNGPTTTSGRSDRHPPRSTKRPDRRAGPFRASRSATTPPRWCQRDRYVTSARPNASRPRLRAARRGRQLPSADEAWRLDDREGCCMRAVRARIPPLPPGRHPAVPNRSGSQPVERAPCMACGTRRRRCHANDRQESARVRHHSPS